MTNYNSYNYNIEQIYSHNRTISVMDCKKIDRKLDIEYYYDIIKVWVDDKNIFIILRDFTVLNSKKFIRKYPIMNDFSIDYPQIIFIK